MLIAWQESAGRPTGGADFSDSSTQSTGDGGSAARYQIMQSGFPRGLVVPTPLGHASHTNES